MKCNTPPVEDGELVEFVSPRAADQKRYFDAKRSCIFVNGIQTSGQEYMNAARELSFLQMCKVIGVYNMSEGRNTIGWFLDVAQCVADKYEFHGPMQRSAKEEVVLASVLAWIQQQGFDPVEAIRRVISRNKACPPLFDLLRNHDYLEAPVFAHSQGNIILCNALCAVAAVDGPEAIRGREIHSFGSPVAMSSWPRGLNRQEYDFTFDPVGMIGGIDLHFRTSKVGVPILPDCGLYSHSFLSYVKDYPRFLINVFRWGILGLTISFDEEGLANALVRMDTNLPLVYDIFRCLAQDHKSDVDDVAVLYVEKITGSSANPSILSAVKADYNLKALLIDAMEEGWTSGRERNAINALKT
jgi:hypothetical protein